MYKSLAICLCLCLVLCSTPVLAQKSNTQMMEMQKASSSISGPYTTGAGMAGATARMPDLTITSAQVTAAPWSYGDLLFIPLQITMMNQGASTSQEFNVGATGRAVDGNAYGFIYTVPGENHMPDPRYGVSVMGLARGASKTFNGILILRPQPITQPLNPGSRYEITAEVDYNHDPDQFGYAWGVKESNEENNMLVINYP